jgi:hypothetical protein
MKIGEAGKPALVIGRIQNIYPCVRFRIDDEELRRYFPE